MSILELRGTGYTYRTQYQQVEALKGVSYSFETGKLHAIMGRSGSGKTTLLSLMAGLDLPTAGQVLFEGTPTSEMDLERYRREKAAVIYQNFRLFPWYLVLRILRIRMYVIWVLITESSCWIWTEKGIPYLRYAAI